MPVPPPARPVLLAIALSTLAGASASAFEKSAWHQVTRSTGTTFLSCRVPACEGALLSYHVQRGGLFRSSKDFDAFRQERYAALRGIGTRAKEIEIRETKVGPCRNFQAINRLVDPSGKAEFHVSGALVGKSVSYTLVSSSPDRAVAERNYRDLLAIVRDLMDGPGIDI